MDRESRVNGVKWNQVPQFSQQDISNIIMYLNAIFQEERFVNSLVLLCSTSRIGRKRSITGLGHLCRLMYDRLS